MAQPTSAMPENRQPLAGARARRCDWAIAAERHRALRCGSPPLGILGELTVEQRP